MALRKMWAVGEATDCSSTKQDKAVGRRDAGLRTVCVAADRSSVPGQNPVLQRHVASRTWLDISHSWRKGKGCKAVLAYRGSLEKKEKLGRQRELSLHKQVIRRYCVLKRAAVPSTAKLKAS
eukprot:1142866-Pelagomonas_calceolata.AAC.6